MDLAYFKRLFDYDHWANERVLNSWEATASPSEEAVHKISHVLVAKELWLARLSPAPFPDFKQALTLPQARKLNEALKERVNVYFSKLTDAQLSEKVAYKNMEGAPYETRLSDILAHMVNHGSYHRGQIALLLKKSGGPSTHTDYIGYVRELDKKH
jgi:uncharacterized damage-inducible protein DinB